MNKKNFVSLLIFIVVISLIAIACTEIENTVSEEKKKELESEIADLESEIDELEEELEYRSNYSELKRDLSTAELRVDHYTIFLEKALGKLNEEEVKEVAKQGYQHDLTIRPTGTTKNREEIPLDGRVKTDLEKFSVEISEKQRAIPDLGDSFLEKAEENKLKYGENYPEEQEWLIVKTEGVDYRHGIGERLEGAGGHSFWLTFEEIERGTTLEIEVDSQIKELTGLETDVLEIVVEE
ncbi:hypothetical protein [Natranaerobius thermophilus]|uniref:Lipoprotein n=1 Tax=Natranaerobius thermophilus (strain ATCC BAA-1301 / DSM 18059 / JW/NM-WN-LF) TaxID=457570 RepID=B2A431_NATTJ|nr:hypothetical protein [Natranaerobius thermophilus]ACB85133.1 hypothetical protein Nther_1556 [Natranaerobius thermophilus JW/NM-WN-LF]